MIILVRNHYSKDKICINLLKMEDMRETAEVYVRFNDVDMQGHVNNARYFTYLEVVRAAFYEKIRKELKDKSIRFILARQEINHIKPIFYPNKLVINMWVSRFGNKSWDFNYEIKDYDGILYALAKTTQVSYDYTTLTSIPIKDDVFNLLNQIYEPE